MGGISGDVFALLPDIEVVLYRCSWRTIHPISAMSESKSPTFEITASDHNHTGDGKAAMFSSILVLRLLNERTCYTVAVCDS